MIRVEAGIKAPAAGAREPRAIAMSLTCHPNSVFLAANPSQAVRSPRSRTERG